MLIKNKLILFCSLFIGFSSVTLATPKESDFYFKIVNTVSKISNIQTIEPELNFKLSHEANFSPGMGLGFGYYINDKVRVDLVFEALKFTFGQQSSNFEFTDAGNLTIGTKSIKRTSFGKSLMLNGFVDVLNKNTFKVFVGTGIGAVRIKEKLTYSFAGNTIATGSNYVFPLLTESYVNKYKTRFGYSLMLGSSININPQLNIELIYSWKNLGIVKHNNGVKSPYKGHNFSISTRFDL